MQSLLATSLLLFAFNSFAIDVFNCEVTSNSKSLKSDVWTKKMLLSRNFSNKITFGKTELLLSVDEENNIRGLVNNQPNFIISGNTDSASFESAYDQGSITCRKSVEVSYLLKFRPWDHYFTLNSGLAKGHILNSVSTQDLKHNLICFTGDVIEANKAISSRVGVDGVVTSEFDIQFSFTDEECISGYGGMDDWTCAQTQVKSITRTVSNCTESQDSRN